MVERYANNLLVCTLQPVERGEAFRQLPLHVTVQPWFVLPEHYHRAFLNGLTNYTHQQSPINIQGGEAAFFGRPVRTLARGIGQLAALHEATAELIERYDGELDQSGVHDRYTPHVSTVGSEEFAAGETAVLRALQLLRRKNNVSERIVEHVLYFGKAGS